MLSLSTTLKINAMKDEGVTFIQIVDDVRQKLAINYLVSGNYKVKDVAYILGYNEQRLLSGPSEDGLIKLRLNI